MFGEIRVGKWKSEILAFFVVGIREWHLVDGFGFGYQRFDGVRRYFLVFVGKPLFI